MELTPERLKQISNSVGVRVGWGFSRMRTKRAPVPWDYSVLVRQFLANPACVLDVGTGGGELFLTFAPCFGKSMGIDVNTEMIEQAIRNKRTQEIANVDFEVKDGNHLEFADAEFEIVLNRHCDVNVSETARVLRPRGYFVTQQVAYRNTLNILKAFGWTPASFGDGWWQPMEELAAAFEQSGCRVVAKAEYDVRY
jgi:SAM-dependent methyltransferase